MKKRLHILFSMLLCCFILFAAFPAFAKSTQIYLNGQVLKSDISPIQKNGTTLVPLRLISENLGASVDYKASNQQITISSSNSTLQLYIGSKTAISNGNTLTLSAAPEVISCTTMVPLRFIGENLNCSIKWDAASQSVIITTAALNTSKDTNAITSKPIVTMIIKDYGTVTLELYPEMAPNTVTNFIVLANKGFYDGLTFHRVIKNFMIQGGDPLGDGTGGPGYSIPGEFLSNGFTQNTLSHTKGILSMARSSAPDSAGSQFFITSADVTYLDGQYAAFGKVTSGMNIIQAISELQTDASDHPLIDVTIESIRVAPNGYTPDSLTVINY